MSRLGAAEVYRAYVEAETARDEAAMTALLAPNIEIELNGVAALASADEDAAAMAALFEAYPDYHREIIDILEQGSRAAARWRMVGHPRPELAERLPVIDIRGCSIVSVQDGRMTAAYVWSPSEALERVLELVSERQ
ncbi:MAG: nuclear transport factor 2 family protein [Candidatus Limnocylindrales bacterium]